ncbi:MAG: mannosyltransferase, partial [Thermoleophilaceae bacterium]|nr:mannosyltransferase [Thermoleophilaceae bacterium]
RSLSALSGTAAVPALYAAGAELVSRRAGLVAGLLAAVSPLLVWYSQEGRSYALLTLLAALSLLFFARALRGGSGRAPAAWAVVSTLAIATHYYGGFLVGAEALWLLWRSPERRRAAIAVAGVGAAGVALLPLALDQRSNGHFASFVAGSGLSQRVKEVPKKFLVGEQGTPGDYGPLVEKLVPVAVVLVLVALALVVWRADRAERRGAAVAASLAAVAVGVPLAVSLAGADVFAAYLLIAAWVPAALVVAAGLAAQRAGALGPGAAALLAALMCAVSAYVAADPTLQRPDVRAAARALPAAGGPRAVVVSPAGALHPLRLYARRLRALPATGVRVAEIDTIGMRSRDESFRDRFGVAAARLRAPVGFRVAARVVGDRFTLVRLVARSPRFVTPRQLGELKLGRSDVAAAVEP